MTDPDVLLGRPPEGEEKDRNKEAKAHWRKVGNEAPVQAIGRIEDAAKQLVAITSGLQGLYFAVFALGDLGRRIPGALVWLFLVPVVLWVGSLICATLVFVPRVRVGADLNTLDEGAWLRIRDTYFATGDTKLRRLHWAHWFLVGSFVAVLVLLGMLAIQPIPPSSPMQIVILTPTP